MNLSRFKILWRHFAKFTTNPNSIKYPISSNNQKLIDVCFYFLIIDFFVSGILLWYPVAIAERLSFFNTLNETNHNGNIITQSLSAVIVAPLVEESIFRLFLGYYKNKSYFRILYYMSALTFGLLHTFTYNIDNSHYLYIPFITMSQTFGGFLLGYIRIIYGFWYGVLLHASFNILGVIWEHAIGFSL